ncbi:MAG: universal stress protein [Cytophagales bacterium]|nr:universal stress protein [Cytophagales bacterium]
MKIKNILIPVDFSKSSKNALKAAIKIAKKAEAKIHMVNAVHIHASMPDGHMIEAIVGDYEEQVKSSFKELESEIIELKDVPHEDDRFVSYLSDAIYSETKKKGIDLIVMGTRSQHTMGERLLGTNAIDTITQSEIPVMVIPEDYHDFPLSKIGFASDFLSVPDYGPLNILKALGSLFDAEVMVFHIADEINRDEQKQIDRIKESLASLPNASIRIVSAESVIIGIRDFTTSHDLDMLCMMSRTHNLFERLFVKSVTKAIAIDIDIPLLTFHQ